MQTICNPYHQKSFPKSAAYKSGSSRSGIEQTNAKPTDSLMAVDSEAGVWLLEMMLTFEYVHSIQEWSKWSVWIPKENTLCLITNEQKHLLCWGLSHVTKLYPSKDEVPQIADLKTRTGMLQHPVSKLYPLP